LSRAPNSSIYKFGSKLGRNLLLCTNCGRYCCASLHHGWPTVTVIVLVLPSDRARLRRAFAAGARFFQHDHARGGGRDWFGDISQVGNHGGATWVSILLLVIWLVAGLVTLLGVLSLAELAAAMPRRVAFMCITNGFTDVSRRFLYGWAGFAVIQTGALAAVCYVFAEHAGQLFPIPVLFDVDDAFRIHLPLLGDIQPFHELGVNCSRPAC
jgi:hypothetical protein